MGSGNGIGKSFGCSIGSEMVLDKKGILGRDNAVFEDARKGWMHNEEKVYIKGISCGGRKAETNTYTNSAWIIGCIVITVISQIRKETNLPQE